MVHQLWDLFYCCGLFDITPDSRGLVSTEEAHLAQIISLLGPPPLDLLDQGKETSRYFDAKGMLAKS